MKNILKNKINIIYSELQKFAVDIVQINPPAKISLITKFECQYNVRLPLDYKCFLSLSNGFNLMGDEILGISFDSKYDLSSVSADEHNNVIVPMPQHIIPFSPDGRGNFYCFDTHHTTFDGESCDILFWCSNYQYTEQDLPEITHNCFCDFVLDCIIGWTLEDYDYCGNPK